MLYLLLYGTQQYNRKELNNKTTPRYRLKERKANHEYDDRILRD